MISHRSAGALLQLLDEGPRVIDVIAPADRGRNIDGIRFHRVRAPRLLETGTVAGIPCTSPSRTLVDLAGTVGRLDAAQRLRAGGAAANTGRPCD